MLRSNATSLFTGAFGLWALLAASGCSPTFNWRDVRPEDTSLSLLLPCKPDKAQKSVPLGGQPVELKMLGCDTGGMTFAVAFADLGDASKAAPVLEQWQKATLANMKAAPVAEATDATENSGASDKVAAASGQPAGKGQGSQRQAIKVKGASGDPSPMLVKATGLGPDGSAVSGQAAYFAKGSQVFQAVVYGKPIAPEAADTFFSSLGFEQ